MKRNHADWLQAYIAYASASEAPAYMHFWSGVSAVAGVLQRKVWFDMGHFQWYPNFYIIIVAPPGIVAKSTTSGIAMKLLRQIEGVQFGPDIVTWPALVSKFAEARCEVVIDNEPVEMSCLTLASSEFGNLLDPQDKKFIDLLVDLWDARDEGIEKVTKNNGCDNFKNPWINIIACTTPSWIADNFPEYIIGGGFTSRCVFVYADKKEKLIAYPFLEMQDKKQKKEEEAKLIKDLEQMSALRGAYTLTKEAIKWGQQWYESVWDTKPPDMDDARFGGYFSRKQSHLHKLAMVLTAVASNDMVIEKEQLVMANMMVTDLETDMIKVFSKIGKSETSTHVDRLVDYLRKNGKTPYTDVYKFIHMHFPSARDFEDVMAGLVKSGQLKLSNGAGGMVLVSAV